MKHIVFKQCGRDILVSNNKGVLLGEINFCSDWNCHVFCPEEETQFDYECLSLIFAKLVELDTR